jgi:hypothetical protein
MPWRTTLSASLLPSVTRKLVGATIDHLSYVGKC